MKRVRTNVLIAHHVPPTSSSFLPTVHVFTAALMDSTLIPQHQFASFVPWDAYSAQIVHTLPAHSAHLIQSITFRILGQ